jgi:hypothetical protein
LELVQRDVKHLKGGLMGKVTSFKGSIGFTGKAVVTAVSTVANLYTAGANAASDTSVGSRIADAQGVRGAWDLGHELAIEGVNYVGSFFTEEPAKPKRATRRRK